MKIGLFICGCGRNISGTIDIDKVYDHFSKLTNYYVFEDQYLCSESGVKNIIKEIKKKKMERIVIAACSLKLHGSLFQKTIQKAGINKFLLSFANIREQNSWVHSKNPIKATKKAIDQINMAVERAKLLNPLEAQYADIIPKTMIIGGGIAGIKAALAIANAGYNVCIIEKRPTIGGYMALFDKTFPTLDCSICVLGPLMSEIDDHPNIKLYTLSKVKKVKGNIGNFKVTVLKKPRFINEDECIHCFDICREVCPIEINDTFFPRRAIDVPFPQAVPLFPDIQKDYCIGCKACAQACEREAIDFNQKEEILEFKVGSIIVSTGLEPFDPSILSELNYNNYQDIITTLQLERMLNGDGPTNGKILRPSTGKPPKRVSFVLCVGSRNKKIHHDYCSQVCCNAAIKQAILVKKNIPNINVNVYYIDIRAVGKNCEEFYNRAREDFGIRFIKSNISAIVKSDTSDELIIRGESVSEDMLFENKTDLVVLAVGIEPAKNTNKLCQILNISQDTYGFLLEKHLKLRSSESSINGIFIAGAIQGPKDIASSIAQAESAAAKVITLFIKSRVELDPYIVYLRKENCDLCRLCLNICEYNALNIKNNELNIIQANCTGCGACAAMCPNEALNIPGFTKKQISEQIKVVLKNKNEFPLIIGFLCNWCSYAGADLAGTSKIEYPTNIRAIRVMCTAMLDPALVFESLFFGADGVIIMGCYENDCHYDSGFIKAKKRYKSVREILIKAGINEDRVRIESVAAGEGEKFAKVVSDFTNKIKGLGTTKINECGEDNSIKGLVKSKQKLGEL
ncbi:MAG: hydrogenase iron-sulfur subunit [Candidatus Lokiarchaeota archaeon]|nr:hydrogenase iron-sulfur subunit [Candidatus Lokiarchaeota archaeon]